MEKTYSPDTPPEPALVVVLGMHRSGTSTITRAMETMGAEFGSRLMPAAAGVNEKGFFEDLDIYAINIDVMTAAGMDWHTMASIELEVIDLQLLDQLRTKAISVLREKCNGKTFALKDPRITRLLPFWKPVFACMGVRVLYVIAVRNPISVAESLAKRNEFPEEKSYVLWLAHVVPALSFTRDSVRTFVNYDRLMDAPSRELMQISSQLGLPLDLERVDEFEKDFLDDRLRHSRFAAQDLSLMSSAPRQVKQLFAAMEAVSCSDDEGHATELDAAVEDAQRYLEDIGPLLRYEWRIEQRVQQLHKTLGDCNRRIGELDNALRDKECSAETAHAQLEQLSDNIVFQQDSIRSLEQRLEQLALEKLSHEDTIRSAECRIEQLAGEILSHNETSKSLETSLQSLETSLQSLEETTAIQRAELLRSAEAIAQFLDSTSWRVTAPLRAIRKYVSARKK